MDSLDNELVPVLHKAASMSQDSSSAVLELIFHIMLQWQTYHGKLTNEDHFIFHMIQYIYMVWLWSYRNDFIVQLEGSQVTWP
jgi:hypothetical protein